MFEPYIGRRAEIRGQGFTLVAFEQWARWRSKCRDCNELYDFAAPSDREPKHPLVRCRACRAALAAVEAQRLRDRVRSVAKARVTKPRQPSLKAKNAQAMRARLARQREVPAT